jgi:hypothetical protein
MKFSVKIGPPNVNRHYFWAVEHGEYRSAIMIGVVASLPGLFACKPYAQSKHAIISFPSRTRAIRGNPANGLTQKNAIWIADAHRGDGKRFVVHANERLTAFLELESAIHIKAASKQRSMHFTKAS